MLRRMHPIVKCEGLLRIDPPIVEPFHQRIITDVLLIDHAAVEAFHQREARPFQPVEFDPALRFVKSDQVFANRWLGKRQVEQRRATSRSTAGTAAAGDEVRVGWGGHEFSVP